MNEKNKHFDKDEHSLSSFNMCIINNTRRESLSYFFFHMYITMGWQSNPQKFERVNTQQ
jgi:hypothetical protein